MSGFEARLGEIRARFLCRAESYASFVSKLDFRNWPDHGAKEALLVDTHKLAGAAGTLGFENVSKAASKLEAALISNADLAAVTTARTELMHCLTVALQPSDENLSGD